MFSALTRKLRRPGTLAWLTAHSQPPALLWSALAVDQPGISGTVRQDAPVTAASPDYNEAVIQIRAGDVKRGTVRSRLHTEDVLVSPGQASTASLDDAASFVSETLTRCAPWVTAYLVPRLRSRQTGYMVAGGLVEDRSQTRLAGLATQDDNGRPVVFLSTDRALEWIRITAHHELWHQVEAVLSIEANARLQACLSPYQHVTAHDDYHRSPSERLARAYGHYASQCDDLAAIGAPIPVMGSGDTQVIYDAFAEVWSGRFATAIKAQGSL